MITPTPPPAKAVLGVLEGRRQLPYRSYKYFTVITVCNRPLKESVNVYMQMDAAFCHDIVQSTECD